MRGVLTPRYGFWFRAPCTDCHRSAAQVIVIKAGMDQSQAPRMSLGQCAPTRTRATPVTMAHAPTRPRS